MHDNVMLVIFSRHEECGKFTANALLRIIEHVSPEVIFEELSLAHYQEAYVDYTLNNSESVAINNYTPNHDVPHFPVNTFQRPPHYDRDLDVLNQKLTDGAGHEYF